MGLIGEKIKQLRIQNNLIQSKLGVLIGVKRSQLSELEYRNHSDPISTIMKVFQVLKAKFSILNDGFRECTRRREIRIGCAINCFQEFKKLFITFNLEQID